MEERKRRREEAMKRKKNVGNLDSDVGQEYGTLIKDRLKEESRDGIRQEKTRYQEEDDDEEEDEEDFGEEGPNEKYYTNNYSSIISKMFGYDRSK